MQPRPGGFVRAKAHDALEVLARDAGAAGRDFEDCTEPHLQGLPRLLEQCAGGEAGLVTADRAFERRPGTDRPHAA